MWLGDTGAGMHCTTDTSLAVKGSLRTNTTVIVTANGTTTHTQIQVRSRQSPTTHGQGDTVAIRLKNVQVLSNASHNLISLGRLATESHVGLQVEAKTGASTLLLPGGHVVPLLNVGVLVVPAANAAIAASPAVVTQGNHESTGGTTMTAELLHTRFNHRRAEVLKFLPKCTRDAPNAWATIARNF
eukprot:6201891-Pleurochrysis_carterae.AAC.1